MLFQDQLTMLRPQDGLKHIVLCVVMHTKEPTVVHLSKREGVRPGVFLV